MRGTTPIWAWWWLFRVIEGTLKKGMRIRTMSTGASYTVDKAGVFFAQADGC